MGIVKTASKRYPKEFLSSWSSGDRRNPPECGSHIVLESICSYNNKMFALAWADKKPKHIIFNAETTLAGKDSIRKRHRKEIEKGCFVTIAYEKHVKRPKVIQKMYEYFSTIDIHDHFRQGSLQFERKWHTHCWWHRVFSSVLGMVIPDAFLAYRHELRQKDIIEDQIDDFSTFLGHLAHQLIFNAFTQEAVRRRSQGKPKDDVPVVEVICMCMSK